MERSRQRFQVGIEAYGRGELHVALEHMLAAQRLYRQPELAYNIGRICERMGEARRAAYWLGAFLTHGSPDAATRADVEQRIEAMGRLAQRQREQIYGELPTRDELTREAQSFFRRGVALYQRGELRAAFEAFDAARRFAELPEIVFNMAMVAEKLGQPEEAYTLYRDYLSLRRDAPDRAEVERRIAALRSELRRR